MSLDKKTTKEIVSELEIGMVCFLHKQTGVPKYVIDDTDPFAADSLALWQEDLDEINNNRDQYIKIEKMSSRETYQIMLDFTKNIKQISLQEKLFDLLNQRKPFRNFKHIVESDEVLAQSWFDFRHQQYTVWINKQLEDIE
jgi:hypothetical protein